MCVIVFFVVLHGIPEDGQLAKTCWIVEINNLCICKQCTLLVTFSLICSYEVAEGADQPYFN
jgi:hypothetical protein